MNKIKYIVFIVFVSFFISFVSMPYHCAASSANEGETEVVAHIGPEDSEQTDTPDGSGSALTQKENTSEKAGKPVHTGDMIFDQMLLFGIMIILACIVILLLRLRHK